MIRFVLQGSFCYRGDNSVGWGVSVVQSYNVGDVVVGNGNDGDEE